MAAFGPILLKNSELGAAEQSVVDRILTISWAAVVAAAEGAAKHPARVDLDPDK